MTELLNFKSYENKHNKRYQYVMKRDYIPFRILWKNNMWVITKYDDEIARNLEDTDCPFSQTGKKWWRKVSYKNNPEIKKWSRVNEKLIVRCHNPLNTKSNDENDDMVSNFIREKGSLDPNDDMESMAIRAQYLGWDSKYLNQELLEVFGFFETFLYLEQ